MKRALFIAALSTLVGCFEDPPSASSGDTTGSSSDGTPASSGSTSAPDVTTTSGPDSTTSGPDGTSGGFGSSSSGSGSEGTDTDGPVPVRFCERPANAAALACADFEDPPPANPWDISERVGFEEEERMRPPPHGDLAFTRFTRIADMASLEVAAQYHANKLMAQPGQALSTRFAVRFPPDLAVACGDGPHTLFWLEYAGGVAGSRVVIVVAIEPGTVRVFQDDDGALIPVGTSNVAEPAAHGWFPLEFVVRFPESGTAFPELDIVGPSQATEAIQLPATGEAADGTLINVAVGPRSRGLGIQPTGCHFDFDDLVLQLQ